MARQEILIDDLTGLPINDGEEVQVVVKYADPKKGQHVLDVSLNTELKMTVRELAEKGKHQGAAGRRSTKRKT